MKIISDLANSSIKNNKKDTFATRVSILLAVILLGTIVFILSDLRQSQIKYLKNTVGDYEVSLSEIDKQSYDLLEKNKDIEKVHYDKIISTDIGLIIYEKSKYFLENIDTHLIDGRNPKNSREIVVTKQFLNKNRNYKIASNIKINEKNYKIVGVYEDFSFSFEDPVAFSYFDDSKGLDFKKGESYFAYIWYKNPRDTYTNTRKILKELNINEKKALDKGQLFYNASLLESKMIFPKGIIPPKRVVNSFIESFGLFFILILLFAVMIYGSFNVYNNRDIKELALLKSSGMTEKQTKKLVKLKAFNISFLPILIGTLLSYLNAIFLTYLMYINNRISYKNMSKILSDNLEMHGFKFYTPDIKSIFIILFFSLLMVYISAIVPARKSSKINIVEGLNGLDKRKNKANQKLKAA
ncbi:MAG: ABC transporter permease [Peptoniphilus grossensis]